MPDLVMSTTYGNEILDYIFGNGAPIAIANAYISLHTGNPGLTGANEVTGGSYARQAATPAAAASKSLSPSADIEFTGLPDLSATPVTYIGIWDASTAGNFIGGGATDTSPAPDAGETIRITVANGTWTIT